MVHVAGEESETEQLRELEDLLEGDTDERGAQGSAENDNRRRSADESAQGAAFKEHGGAQGTESRD